MSLTNDSGFPFIPRFLDVPGEMGRLIAEFNWTITSIGSIEGWPQSLRTAVGMMLRSKFPMLIWWGNDLIQFYNDPYRSILRSEGKHPEAIGKIGKDCWPEAWEVIYPLIQQVKAGQSPWSEDQLVPIHRNGGLEDVYVTFSYSAILDESEEIGGILVTCYENTEKAVQYQKIVESENQLSFAIDAAELGTWDYNPLTNKFAANDRLKSWFGIVPSQEIDLSLVLKAISRTDRENVLTSIERALQYGSGGFYDVTCTIIANGSSEERIVRAKGRAWFDESQIACRFNGTLQDITEQESAHKKIREAEERAWLAVGTANLGTYEIDLISEQFTPSERFTEVWGCGPTEDGKKAIHHIHPDDLEARAKAHQDALSTGFLDYEARVLWPDQSIRWVKLHGKVLYDSHGTPITLLGVIQDITDQKRFAEELARQVKERTLQLQRSNEDLLQFAHVITHDLKEPVRKVKVYNNRILEEYDNAIPDQVRKYVLRVGHAADRMSSMIDGVLNYSSVGSSEEEMELVDLNDIFDNIENDLELVIQQKHGMICRSVLPSICAAPVLLHQLFYNILNNSLKFSRTDVRPKIEVSWERYEVGDKEMVRIIVADNGIGFANRHKEDIFQSFSRLHSKDRFEGTGLGLALCKRIVERHNGLISAIGDEGRGAKVIVALPVKN